MIGNIEAAWNAALTTAASARGYGVAWEGAIYTPVTGVPYLTAKQVGLRRVPLGNGAGCSHQWSATLALTLVMPGPIGVPAARAAAMVLMGDFPRARTLVSGPAAVVIETADMRDAYSTVGWNNVPLLFTWTCEE